MDDGNIAHVDLDRCIGCGVCVTKCPSDAIQMIKKDQENIPPPNMVAMYQEMAKKRAELQALKEQQSNA